MRKRQSELGAFADRVLRRASQQAEAQLSLVRSFFCLLVAARIVWLLQTDADSGISGRAAFKLPLVLGAFALSLWLALRLRKGHMPPWVTLTSVVFDAVVCFLALFPNVLRPFAGYRGVLMMPEIAAFLAMVMAAGFRVTQATALLGAGANAFALTLLLGLDLARNGPLVAYRVQHILMYGILFGCVAMLALIAARRTRRLVVESAERGRRVQRAERNLEELLEEHHDAATMLTAAMVSAASLKTVAGSPVALEALSGDLAALRTAVAEIREHAYADVLAIGEPALVEVEAALNASRDLIDRAAHPTVLTWRIDAPALRVRLPGGERALRRVLLNLVVNSKQGDGRRGAVRAVIDVRRVDASLCVSVEDDGPGLVHTAKTSLSSKPNGTGSGLRLVRSVMSAAGGAVDFLPREPFGTTVRLRLPLA